MKGVAPPDYKREFIPIRNEEWKDKGGTWRPGGWSVKFHSEISGTQPVGPRLSKGSLPNIGLEADNEAECMVLCEEWNTWYDKEWGSLRKRASTRTSSRRKRVV